MTSVREYLIITPKNIQNNKRRDDLIIKVSHIILYGTASILKTIIYRKKAYIPTEQCTTYANNTEKPV